MISNDATYFIEHLMTWPPVSCMINQPVGGGSQNLLHVTLKGGKWAKCCHCPRIWMGKRAGSRAPGSGPTLCSAGAGLGGKSAALLPRPPGSAMCSEA